MDSSGNSYVTGSTTSTNFPTMNPLQPANGDGGRYSDAFVAKLNPTGSALVYPKNGSRPRALNVEVVIMI